MYALSKVLFLYTMKTMTKKERRSGEELIYKKIEVDPLYVVLDAKIFQTQNAESLTHRNVLTTRF